MIDCFITIKPSPCFPRKITHVEGVDARSKRELTELFTDFSIFDDVSRFSLTNSFNKIPRLNPDSWLEVSLLPSYPAACLSVVFDSLTFSSRCRGGEKEVVSRDLVNERLSLRFPHPFYEVNNKCDARPSSTILIYRVFSPLFTVHAVYYFVRFVEFSLFSNSEFKNFGFLFFFFIKLITEEN